MQSVQTCPEKERSVNKYAQCAIPQPCTDTQASPALAVTRQSWDDAVGGAGGEGGLGQSCERQEGEGKERANRGNKRRARNRRRRRGKEERTLRQKEDCAIKGVQHWTEWKQRLGDTEKWTVWHWAKQWKKVMHEELTDREKQSKWAGGAGGQRARPGPI